MTTINATAIYFFKFAATQLQCLATQIKEVYFFHQNNNATCIGLPLVKVTQQGAFIVGIQSS